MKKTTKSLIKYYFPSLLFAAEASEEVKKVGIPKKLPRNCYAFRFGQQDVVEDGKEVFTKPATWKDTLYTIGEVVRLEDIPNNDRNQVLRANIENNSPLKKGIKTHLGNWVNFDKNTCVIPVERFTFENRWV